jgi:23S rRNA (pseudouridine1915-N3)-methyltransferase
LRLIAVGKFRAGPEADLFQRYARRLKPALGLRELPEAAGSPAEIRKREAEAILGGTQPTSEAFAAMLLAWTDAARPPAFVIGGAEGLAAAVTARADAVLSLGAMTWPHMLIRVMLAEQLFRAQCIANGHPYHRGFRP